MRPGSYNAYTTSMDSPHSDDAAGACLPGSHAWQLFVVASRYSPAAHGRHTGWPVPLVAVPLAHGWQSSLPARSAKVATGHASQPLDWLDAPAIVPRVPGGQAVQVTAPCPLYMPRGHRVVHDVCAVSGLWNPGAQFRHEDLPEICPYWPAGQGRHAEDSLAPSVKRYRPAAHGEQLK